MDEFRATLIRWVGPALLAGAVTLAVMVGHGMWTRHNAQHAEMERVIQFLNQQIAAAQARQGATP